MVRAPHRASTGKCDGPAAVPDRRRIIARSRARRPAGTRAAAVALEGRNRIHESQRFRESLRLAPSSDRQRDAPGHHRSDAVCFRAWRVCRIRAGLRPATTDARTTVHVRVTQSMLPRARAIQQRKCIKSQTPSCCSHASARQHVMLIRSPFPEAASATESAPQDDEDAGEAGRSGTRGRPPLGPNDGTEAAVRSDPTMRRAAARSQTADGTAPKHEGVILSATVLLRALKTFGGIIALEWTFPNCPAQDAWQLAKPSGGAKTGRRKPAAAGKCVGADEEVWAERSRRPPRWLRPRPFDLIGGATRAA